MAGTQLLQANIVKWRGEIPIESLYSAGVGGQRFFKALKEKGELMGTRCRPCHQVFVPCRQFCERCFAELTEEVRVEPDGIIKSFSYAYLDHKGRHLKQPVAWALVQLEGATTVMLHKLLDVKDLSRLSMGSRVKTVIKPKGKRAGSILDIEGFRLVE